jgi:hypothetical protein
MNYQEENLKEKIESSCKGLNKMPDALVKLIAFEPTQENNLQGLFELHWFDDEVLSRLIKDAKMRERFAVFGKRADGYPYALWLDDENIQRVIRFHSGDSAIYLANSFMDFMVLLSMGHFEEGEKNINFQPWIEKTFEIKIPESDTQLIKNVKEKNELFIKWMHENCKGF